MTFKTGDVVICHNASGYRELKDGETYIIDAAEPSSYEKGFLWPGYVHIVTPDKRIACHADRFKKVGT